jgi:hypothetical protein
MATEEQELVILEKFKNIIEGIPRWWLEGGSRKCAS